MNAETHEPHHHEEQPESPETSDQNPKFTDNPAADPADDPVDEPTDPMEQLKQERDELYNRLQRVSADYQNFIKRSEQRLSDSINFAKGDLLKSFIPVLDHFDTALSQQPESDEAKQLYDGVAMVRDELLKVLNQHGVQRVEVQVGDEFDPDLHEAMMRQPAEGVEPGHVSLAMQCGYIMGGRTLRPAKVAVAPDTAE